MVHLSGVFLPRTVLGAALLAASLLGGVLARLWLRRTSSAAALARIVSVCLLATVALSNPGPGRSPPMRHVGKEERHACAAYSGI